MADSPNENLNKIAIRQVSKSISLRYNILRVSNSIISTEYVSFLFVQIANIDKMLTQVFEYVFFIWQAPLVKTTP